MTSSALNSMIFVFSTLGSESSDESRIKDLCSELPTTVFPFDRSSKRSMFWQLLSLIRSRRPRLMVMEGTGLAGGMALILGRWIWKVPYVVSSGDAVGPWVSSHYRILGPIFTAYEKCLCRNAMGYIGWTPYLVGRAMTFGTPRGITAAGWAPFHRTIDQVQEARTRIRRKLGIPQNAIVIGIAGSMVWSKRYQYCYGWELVEAFKQIQRRDLYVLLVGDGSGKSHLEKAAGAEVGQRILFTGRVPQSEVPDYLAAMDIGSLPQSVDQTGSFRYTTKISEYIDARLPMATSQIPMSYDLDEGWIWRIPGDAPWEKKYTSSLSQFLQDLKPEQIHYKKQNVPVNSRVFDKASQIARCGAFLRDLLEQPMNPDDSSSIGT